MILPSEFVERTRALLGEETFQLLEAALLAEPPISLRINRAKCDKERVGAPVPWSSTGVYLDERPTFTFDPLFHAGCYYVQEASSMFVEQVLRAYVKEPVVMLDLCAAPGGKSTHARAVLPEGSLLVANEVIRNRSQILAENLIKWGNAEVVVTNNDPAAFAALPELFDVIMADVPCSGEGMFRKDAVAVEEWSADNVQQCWQRQRNIVAAVWEALKPGGLFIYSTCTYNREENEDNVAWMVREWGAEVLPVPTVAAWAIMGNQVGMDFPVYRFLPHNTKGEGFFLAVLRKAPEALEVSRVEKRTKKRKETQKVQPLPLPPAAKTWLRHADSFQWEVKGTTVIAFPKAYGPVYTLLQQSLKVIHAGVTVGECKGKDLVPAHSLAMSSWVDRAAFPTVDITYTQAIAYLRKEALTLDESVSLGYVLLTYRDIPLGFVKNLGRRANNLYPQEWRIRSGYLPDALSMVWKD